MGEPTVQQVLDTALAWAVINNHFEVADFLSVTGLISTRTGAPMSYIYFPVISFRSARSLSGITTATQGTSAAWRRVCHSTVCGVPGFSETGRLDGSAVRLSVRMAMA